jgi:hypothetical protein
MQKYDQPGFPLQFLSPCGACGISAAILAAWASSNFAKQNCDQPLAPHGLIAGLNLLTVYFQGEVV